MMVTPVLTPAFPLYRQRVLPANPWNSDNMPRAKSIAQKKPNKPYSDFPLYAHATGRWAKRIRGKLHYFGPWSDPQGAMNLYLSQRDDLYAGRRPRPSSPEARSPAWS